MWLLFYFSSLPSPSFKYGSFSSYLGLVELDIYRSNLFQINRRGYCASNSLEKGSHHSEYGGTRDRDIYLLEGRHKL